MARIEASTTSEAQHRLAVSQFEKRPEPPGPLLTWVCPSKTSPSCGSQQRCWGRPKYSAKSLARGRKYGRAWVVNQAYATVFVVKCTIGFHSHVAHWAKQGTNL